MALSKREVAMHIRDAFHGVTLGNGIGLLEGQGLDDYEEEATRKAYRERDEKDDWERIPVKALNRCNSSLSFFDAEGMRFHLPAFMIAELNGESDMRASLTAFLHRGLSPHQFTPMSGAHNRVESSRRCLSPIVLVNKLGSTFCAPPLRSPAVAHSKRSAKAIVTFASSVKLGYAKFQ